MEELWDSIGKVDLKKCYWLPYDIFRYVLKLWISQVIRREYFLHMQSRYLNLPEWPGECTQRKLLQSKFIQSNSSGITWYYQWHSNCNIEYCIDKFCNNTNQTYISDICRRAENRDYLTLALTVTETWMSA